MSTRAPRGICVASLIVTGADSLAAGAVGRMAPGAGHASAAVVVMAMEMPARWKNVHDCDRPSRWREKLDNEDCKVYTNCLESGGDCAKTLADLEAGVKMPDVGGSSHGADSGYSELVPNLVSMQDFIEANRLASRHNKLLLVKFYSKRCRACLRIAANYRRLARKYADEIECYEMEQHAAGRELLEALSVTQVPTIQIFDGAGMNRLASLDCQPAQFKEVERTIVASIEARRQELMEFAMVGGQMGQEFIEAQRNKHERVLDDLLKAESLRVEEQEK